MRFGLFIPQGWRMDLVGIDPADQWATMNGLVTRADAGETFESVWVYDHFHTVPEPTKEATHEAWTLMAAFAATTSRIRLGHGVEVVVDPDRLEGLARVRPRDQPVHGGPLVGRVDADQVHPPALRNEESEAHASAYVGSHRFDARCPPSGARPPARVERSGTTRRRVVTGTLHSRAGVRRAEGREVRGPGRSPGWAPASARRAPGPSPCGRRSRPPGRARSARRRSTGRRDGRSTSRRPVPVS